MTLFPGASGLHALLHLLPLKFAHLLPDIAAEAPGIRLVFQVVKRFQHLEEKIRFHEHSAAPQPGQKDRVWCHG